ncbi:CWC16 protein [Piptocephalis cylindrospora]|uniref:CWC16 protein n=1 Tax=Piptocephalis cylindrospora TaxID=1907219 RepID=A0A4P9Y4K1_9FUNG|nr:CWC16 protein [Piptocephalis cylindrospora]|eukprot:RKP12770.1 CWC16 protein [Piptocephalis cylindrospora]
MADRKAINKYYPPDYDPSKGGLNKAQGSHVLRKRARKLDQGILVIRSAILFSASRFNAEKKRVGSYYTTPVWSFRMKCPSCSQWFEIHTDPKNSEYIVVSGARKRAEVPEEQEEQEERKARDKERREVNSFARAEYEEEEKRRKREAEKRIAELQQVSDTHWEDPFEKNQRARHLFRQGRALRDEESKKDSRIQDRYSLSIPLLAPCAEDEEKAKLTAFQGKFILL